MELEKPQDEQVVRIAFHLLQISSQIVRYTHQFLRQQPEDVRVTMAQLRVLHMAQVYNPTLSEVADMLHVTRPTATRLVDGLVERGWLEREIDRRDRRRIRLKTTAEGEAVRQKMRDMICRYLASHLSSLPSDDLETIERCLRSLEQAWDFSLDLFME